MREDEKLLCELVKEAKSPGETVRILLNKGVVSTTALRDIDVYYTYRDRFTHTKRIMSATYDTAIDKRVSDSTVYRARKRFEN